MKTSYIIRNKQTGQVYIDNAKTFGEAVEASRMVKNEPIEMVKTTTEVISNYDLRNISNNANRSNKK